MLVLAEVRGLGDVALTSVNGFTVIVPRVIDSTSVSQRKTDSETLRLLLSIAARRLGTDLNYQIGDGTVMF